MKLKTLTSVTLAASFAFAPLAHAEIVIGLIAPLTGPVAAYGDQVKNGAQTAVNEINKKGGILGEQIVLKLADDGGEPKQGVSAACSGGSGLWSFTSAAMFSSSAQALP